MPSQSEDSVQPLIELEVVRCDQPHAGGRPLFLNARRFICICRAIERGESASEACRQQLTTYRNFRMHVARNPKYQRRLRQAEEVREHFLREFHVANITKHSAKNVAASIFWLERRYPQEFALKAVNRDSGDVEQFPLCDKMSLEQLVANAKLAAEIAANPPPGLPEMNFPSPDALQGVVPALFTSLLPFTALNGKESESKRSGWPILAIARSADCMPTRIII